LRPVKILAWDGGVNGVWVTAFSNRVPVSAIRSMVALSICF
jgi:hypothetical protein